MADSLLDQDSACLLKIQQYAMQQIPALTTEQKKQCVIELIEMP
jgi:hypothetical protein